MKNKLLKWLLLLLIAAGIGAVIVYRDQLDADALQSWIEGAGAAAPLLFMLVYIVGTVFFFPGSVLTLLGGALFGPVLGTFYNLTAATIGAMLSFLVARYLASDWVMNKTGGRLKQLMDGVEKVYLRKTLELSYSLRGDPALRPHVEMTYKGKNWVMR